MEVAWRTSAGRGIAWWACLRVLFSRGLENECAQKNQRFDSIWSSWMIEIGHFYLPNPSKWREDVQCSNRSRNGQVYEVATNRLSLHAGFQRAAEPHRRSPLSAV